MAPWSKALRGEQRTAPADDLVTRIHNRSLETPTTLPAGIQLSHSTRNRSAAAAIDGLSSSESETYDPSPIESRPPRPGHSRSMSQPFPSLFGSAEKKQAPVARRATDMRFGDQENTMPRPGLNTHRRGSHARNSSKDFATGNCMTCASMVRWPRELAVFKCTICATVNDLVPPPTDRQARIRMGHAREPLRDHRSPGKSDIKRVQAPPSISVDHSKRLIRQCLRSYMMKKFNNAPSSITTKVESERAGLTGTSEASPLPVGGVAAVTGRQDGAGFREPLATNGSSSYDAQRGFEHGPTLRPAERRPSHSMTRSYSSSYPERPRLHANMPNPNSKSSGSREPNLADSGAKKIFKSLEDYIITCFGSYECINSSFVLAGPRSQAPPVHEPVRRKPVPNRESFRSMATKDSAREESQDDAHTFELDPKLLLLGDVAENGMWWAGGQDEMLPPKACPNPADNDQSTLITFKSPQIDWTGLYEWYSDIINAAQGWFSVYEEVFQEPDFGSPTERDLKDLERDLLRAQEHLRRVLMKATELLLKRPGRPIADPALLRCLLVMLANPILDDSFKPFKGLIQDDNDDSNTNRYRKGHGDGRSPNSKSGVLSGRHSGIIKRIVGLISNSSDSCHHQLIAWFAKYPAPKLTQVKDLVFGFLTYRMLRQSDKELEEEVDVTAGLIPEMQAGRSGAYLHDEIGASSASKKAKQPAKTIPYADDWQIKAASRFLALIFAANDSPSMRRGDELYTPREASLAAVRNAVPASGQLLFTSDFYNSMVDYVDLVGDFDAWESKRGKFTFCQYPFLLSVWAKKKILEHDTRRQMQTKARDAFFDSIMTRKSVNQYLILDVRRDCLVDDSLQAVSEVIGSGGEDIKKGLRVTFRGEEGIDGGGLRKEWFLLLIREVFNPDHGLFIYDEDSQYCYFNPNSFETSDQFFLVGVVMGLAIYNSTILDVALPPFAFRKLLASAPTRGLGPSAHPRPAMRYTLNDLVEYRPRLAQSFRQLLEFDGDVEEAFCLDFVIDVERYGTTATIPLCPGGDQKPVTNNNRKEYVELYTRYLLDTAVSRQFEPFKRGFYTVCGGNAFSLFRAEEVELLVRGSDEALDIDALRGVAQYENWGHKEPDGREIVLDWFWKSFERASPSDQRRLLLFVTGSDRIPAMGAAALAIKISCLGDDSDRLPIGRTCFNMLSIWRYATREKLESKLWTAVRESEGFGLK